MTCQRATLGKRGRNGLTVAAGLDAPVPYGPTTFNAPEIPLVDEVTLQDAAKPDPPAVALFDVKHAVPIVHTAPSVGYGEEREDSLVSYLAVKMDARPSETVSVISQVARATFPAGSSGSVVYYLVQAFTLAILAWSDVGKSVFGSSLATPFGLDRNVWLLLLSLPVLWAARMFFTGAVVLWLAHRGARAGTEALTGSVFREVSGRAATHTRAFVLRAAPVVESLAQLADKGLAIDDPDRLAPQLLAVLKANPGLSWVSYSDENGTFTGRAQPNMSRRSPSRVTSPGTRSPGTVASHFPSQR